jgi:hypothetical protein
VCLEILTAIFYDNKGDNLMTKREDFVTLVQTAAIVESITRKTVVDTSPNPSTSAAIAVSVAQQVPEAQLPDDLVQACDKLIAHIYDNTIPKPDWLIGII